MRNLRDSIDATKNSNSATRRVAQRLNRLAQVAEQSPKIPSECRFGHTQLFALEARHIK